MYSINANAHVIIVPKRDNRAKTDNRVKNANQETENKQWYNKPQS